MKSTFVATRSTRLGQWVLAAVVCAALTGCPSRRSTTGPSDTPTGQVYHVGIDQVASHPLLDAVREGFKKRLSELGYVEGTNIVYDEQNAQGDMTTAQTITEKFVSGNVDLIFPIGTAPAQAAVKATTTIPIVFGAVTDPVSAGLVTDPAAPGGNVTGTSDLSPFRDQLALLKEIVPSVKTIGIIYNPGEANSAFGVEQTKKAAAALGLQVETASIASTNEVMAAAQALIKRVDALYSGTDNTVVSALESLVKVAGENNKPLLSADPDSVQRGAAFTIGVDYEQVGIESASLADKILKGASPGSLPVVYAPGTVLALNKEAAAQQGVTFSEELLGRATKVYDRIEQPSAN